MVSQAREDVLAFSGSYPLSRMCTSLVFVSLSRNTTSNCLLVLHNRTSVKDFSQVFRMPQAVTSSSLKELMHFCDSHDVIHPGSGS